MGPAMIDISIIWWRLDSGLWCFVSNFLFWASCVPLDVVFVIDMPKCFCFTLRRGVCGTISSVFFWSSFFFRSIYTDPQANPVQLAVSVILLIVVIRNRPRTYIGSVCAVVYGEVHKWLHEEPHKPDSHGRTNWLVDWLERVWPIGVSYQ